MTESPEQLTAQLEALHTTIAQRIEAIARHSGRAKKEAVLLAEDLEREAALRAELQKLLRQTPESATLPASQN